ncbi:DUF2852 domain-containing protein [Defluviimonas sp. WL0050]|uniref:DUF2852 domain-containing protein n=1 Tax=Albidovulum litorale TaxID=2984134 RepID=A0ABT2ZPS1_9RHOB|nr:DUF2852 domain-containing protein [Defluviimonas sp. WL0050]MCV2873149.1 DUF2852 domain-containing protein [Defluviimonas sp. WL0050]
MSTIAAWPSRAEMWLDERGKGAWIAAMVLGFIFFWPVGLALLAYMIWSKRMFSKGCGWSRNDAHHHMSRCHARRHGFRSSGNTAFDAYKADTLDRLEREQEEFETFLKRLRESKDKAEFDQYLDERARAAQETGTDADDETKDRSGSGAY